MESGDIGASGGGPGQTGPNSVGAALGKFRSFHPLELRKLTLYNSDSTPSSQENSPKGSPRELRRQGSQSRLRESLLASLLSPRTKEIEFTVPPTHSTSPLTPPLLRKAVGSDSSESTSCATSRANSPSPVIMMFKSCSSDIAGAYVLGALNPELYKVPPETDEADGEDYPEDHVGRLWYAMKYDTSDEKLVLSLIKARNLPSRSSCSSNNGCDPFVRLCLMPDERRTLQSKQLRKTCNPQFEETFGFQISPKELSERTLKFSIYDVDRNKRHVVIGHVLHQFKDVEWSQGRIVMKQDLVKDMEDSPSPSGEVLLSLCYNNNLGRLTVTVFEARGIKPKSGQVADLYSRVTLLQQTKQVKSKKTGIVRYCEGDDHTSFKESFHFKMAGISLDTASVCVQVMQANPGYNKDQVLGRVVIGSFMFARGKGLDHWNEMLAKSREQVQYWHPLAD